MGDIRTDIGAPATLRRLLVAGFLGSGKTRIVRTLTGATEAPEDGAAPFRERAGGACRAASGADLSVVEASPFLVPGSGDPGQIVVTAVDAVNAVANLADADLGALVAGQIRAADVVVLTCGDVTDPGPARQAVAALAGGPVIEAHAEPDLAGAILSRATTRIAAGPAGPDGPARAPDDRRAAFTVWSYSGSAVLTRDAMAAFLTGRPAGAYRVRGVVRLAEGGGRIDLFGRGRRTSLIEPPAETVLAAAGPRRRLAARDMDLAFAEAVAAATYGRGLIACR